MTTFIIFLCPNGHVGINLCIFSENYETEMQDAQVDRSLTAVAYTHTCKAKVQEITADYFPMHRHRFKRSYLSAAYLIDLQAD